MSETKPNSPYYWEFIAVQMLQDAQTNGIAIQTEATKQLTGIEKELLTYAEVIDLYPTMLERAEILAKQNNHETTADQPR